MKLGKICLVLFVAATLVTVFGNKGLFDYLSFRKKVEALDAANRDLLATKVRLEKEIGMLNDRRYIEKLALHDLGMVKAGDVVYRFVEPEGKTLSATDTNGGDQR